MKMFNPAEFIRDSMDEGLFRVDREIFTSAEIFEMEMRHIFGATWIFLGLESQLPRPHDFLATNIGRQPVLVTRDAKARTRAFMNTCRHRGAVLCHSEVGNKKFHVCPYHGWAYDSSGANVQVTDRADGCYHASFDNEGHDLVPLPRFATYKGLMFGCLNPHAPSLEDWLGGVRIFVDLVMEQGPRGMEFVPGRNLWAYDANWKLQIDNSDDTYRLFPTHSAFTDILHRRNSGQSRAQVEMPSWNDRLDAECGTYTFPHGHTLTWVENKTPSNRPLFRQIDEVRRRVGETRVHWMLQNRNLTLYPSVQLCDSTSLILRTIRPVSVDRTEMRIWCLAPIGEDPESREFRLRQHEDFFSASGLANADDNAVYEDCQTGYMAKLPRWLHGFERGMTRVERGPDARARELGFTPDTSLSGRFRICDETVHQSGYREWARLLSGAQFPLREDAV